jgi:signal transduction histidine kinase
MENSKTSATTKATFLQDFKINVKIKLSALWASLTLCYLYGDYFELYVPKKVEGLVSGANMLDSPTKLFLAALLLAIPAVMVFLSIVLKPLLNKWLNIIFGIFFTLFVALVGVASISSWRAFYVFLALIEVLITSTISVYAWNWPKQEDQSTTL